MFKKNIKEIFRRNGFGTKDVARHFNITEVTASGWISGRSKPRPSTIKQIYDLTNGQITYDDWMHNVGEYKRIK